MPDEVLVNDGGQNRSAPRDEFFSAPSTPDEVLSSYLFKTVNDAEFELNRWIDSIRAQKVDGYSKTSRDGWLEEKRMAEAFQENQSDPSAPFSASDQATLSRAAMARNRTVSEHASVILANAGGLIALGEELHIIFLTTSTALRAAASPADYEGIVEAAKLSAQTLEATFGVTV